MLEHVQIGVTSLERSRAFYDAALRPLGIRRISDFEARGSDYGSAPAPFGVEFTVSKESGVAPLSGMHVCFRAPTREAVTEFYEAALRHGGRDDGPPGVRRYHASYYAAFVLDPDGHRIEAVCHAPEAPDASDPP
jgi:catechol 2,3-dioxygenase-like lactoylglutathione lyase family enzyme